MSKTRKYLITGASGFIGSCILRELIARGENAAIILRQDAKIWRIKDLLPRVKCYYSDLSDAANLEDIFKSFKPDVIYHLATSGAYSYQNDADTIIKTNILGSWNMIKASLDIDYELFINTGSSSEYGHKTSIMKETDLLEPDSYYAIAKAAQTHMGAYVAKSKSKPIVTIRPFSVYGPYEEPTRFIPVLMNALFFKNEMKLVDPNTARDMIYIDDIVDAYLMVDSLSKIGGEYLNICSGVQSTIKNIVDIAVKVTGKNTEFSWGGMEGRSWDKTIWVGDNSKAKKLLGWSPKIGLEEGLRRMWEWYRDNHKLYNH